MIGPKMENKTKSFGYIQKRKDMGMFDQLVEMLKLNLKYVCKSSLIGLIFKKDYLYKHLFICIIKPKYLVIVQVEESMQ